MVKRSAQPPLKVLSPEGQLMEDWKVGSAEPQATIPNNPKAMMAKSNNQFGSVERTKVVIFLIPGLVNGIGNTTDL
jgi:hypothetical protein